MRVKNKYEHLEQFFTVDQYLISIHPDIWEDPDRSQDLWSYAIYNKEEFETSYDTCDSILEGFSYVTFDWCKEVAFSNLQENIDNNFNEYNGRKI